MESVAQLNDRALSLHAAGDVTGALQTFRRGIENYPDQPVLLLNCATLLDAAGFADAAVSLYERLIASNPRNAHALISKGLTLFRQARNDEAEAALLAGLELEPHDVRANFAMY